MQGVRDAAVELLHTLVAVHAEVPDASPLLLFLLNLVDSYLLSGSKAVIFYLRNCNNTQVMFVYLVLAYFGITG